MTNGSANNQSGARWCYEYAPLSGRKVAVAKREHRTIQEKSPGTVVTDHRNPSVHRDGYKRRDGTGHLRNKRRISSSPKRWRRWRASGSPKAPLASRRFRSWRSIMLSSTESATTNLKGTARNNYSLHYRKRQYSEWCGSAVDILFTNLNIGSD